MHFEKTVVKKDIFTGKVFRVVEETVELENNQIAKREIVLHNGGASIVAVDENLCIYLVRQFRKPFDMETLEIPAGKLEPGENPYSCAVRELKEETGIVAEHIESLGYILTTPGFCNEKLYLYLATRLSAGEMQLDSDEFLSVEKFPLSRCVEMIEEGEIIDSKTVVGILRAARKFNC